ncbi:MAG: histidine biosynthesis protein [Gammaproteobacteria bacterium]|nr:histidine biosynthesis protein [Gammaproteobacteria bacterium]NIQ74653.1 histidine biosynthesis protein [Gammaproteobacteria bacterium]NIT05805.1 histidine biosynthesis protein [Gammaproteobacteria bacterium]NIV25964.1 histidine biosynthesis protein [Gammaproteobacteria bacterium]
MHLPRFHNRGLLNKKITREMRIIPVIDILDGKVVHAIRGQRNAYQPITSSLSHCSQPDNILQGFLGLYPFEIFYIADLNAIMNKGNNVAVIKKLITKYPRYIFWLDAGANIFGTSPSMTNLVPIIGSETNITMMELADIRKEHNDIVLSLDFRDKRLLGNTSLLESTREWPENIILMNLDRVGTGSGYDRKLLNNFLSTYRDHNVFIAGGIHKLSELLELKHYGVSGVLLATALHRGEVTEQDLITLQEA